MRMITFTRKKVKRLTVIGALTAAAAAVGICAVVTSVGTQATERLLPIYCVERGDKKISLTDVSLPGSTMIPAPPSSANDGRVLPAIMTTHNTAAAALLKKVMFSLHCRNSIRISRGYPPPQKKIMSYYIVTHFFRFVKCFLGFCPGNFAQSRQRG